jgi:hypothetical protein
MLKLARTRFYLSSCPFNLADNVDMMKAPSLKGYYHDVGARSQLIAWLEENHCETIYCRELTAEEVRCAVSDPKCVPEFVSAYRNALAKLRGNHELALKLITNYPPLSSPRLRTGFHDAMTEWLGGAVEAVERATGGGHKIRSAITNKKGAAYFYDLCPGKYYISSVGPVNVGGTRLFWESAGPVDVAGTPYDMTQVTLAFPGKVGSNLIVVGKPWPETAGGQTKPVP